MRMPRPVNRIITIGFVALLPACATVRTPAVKNTTKTFTTVVVDGGFLSNRSEGSQARDWEYRELLADRIAEAIVEQRYGTGVYRGSVQVAAQTQPQAESPTGGTGLAPAAPHR